MKTSLAYVIHISRNLNMCDGHNFKLKRRTQYSNEEYIDYRTASNTIDYDVMEKYFHFPLHIKEYGSVLKYEYYVIVTI